VVNLALRPVLGDNNQKLNCGLVCAGRAFPAQNVPARKTHVDHQKISAELRLVRAELVPEEPFARASIARS
jgi:hypothetical protein